MFKSMFARIFVTYFSILILIMLVLSFTISSLAENYVYGEKKQMLENVADRANNAANSFSSGELSQYALTEVLNALGYVTDTKIYIVQGSIPGEVDLGGELSGQFLKDALGKALNGESVFLRSQYSADFDARMLFGAYPWQELGSINGAILLFSPEKEVSSIIGNLQLAIWLTAAGFFIIGGIIIFTFSRRIVSPIKAIDEASARMAVGERVDDLKIDSNDEIGSMARSFNSMKQKIDANEKLRQDLIANISHDLRTPLTNINGYLTGMADGVIANKDYPKYLRVLRSETKRLTDLTGEILEIAKIQSGSIDLNKERFKLSKAAEEAVASNSVFAKTKDIKIKVDIGNDLYANADVKKIRQVLYNLINNAVKYSQSGTSVKITALKKNGLLKVCVEDSGSGIAKDDLPYIFERFYKTTGSNKQSYGLGLHIAKTYVEAHGGHIEISNGAQGGTRACFTLPI